MNTTYSNASIDNADCKLCTSKCQKTGTNKAPISLMAEDVLDLVEKNVIIGSTLHKLATMTGIATGILSRGVLAVICLYLLLGHWAALVCKIVGLGYPAFATVQGLINGNAEERKIRNCYWLRYWIVYSVIHTLSFISDSHKAIFHPPGYWLCKAVILLWCWMPPFHGAQRIYKIAEKYIGLAITDGNVSDELAPGSGEISSNPSVTSINADHYVPEDQLSDRVSAIYCDEEDDRHSQQMKNEIYPIQTQDQ